MLRKNKCKGCNGSGKLYNMGTKGIVECSDCNGEGTKLIDYNDYPLRKIPKYITLDQNLYTALDEERKNLKISFSNNVERRLCGVDSPDKFTELPDCFEEQGKNAINGKKSPECLNCKVFEKCHKLSIAGSLKVIHYDCLLIAQNKIPCGEKGLIGEIFNPNPLKELQPQPAQQQTQPPQMRPKGIYSGDELITMGWAKLKKLAGTYGCKKINGGRDFYVEFILDKQKEYKDLNECIDDDEATMEVTQTDGVVICKDCGHTSNNKKEFILKYKLCRKCYMVRYNHNKLEELNFEPLVEPSENLHKEVSLTPESYEDLSVKIKELQEEVKLMRLKQDITKKE